MLDSKILHKYKELCEKEFAESVEALEQTCGNHPHAWFVSYKCVKALAAIKELETVQSYRRET